MDDKVRLYNEIIDCLKGDLNRYTSLKLCEHTPEILLKCGLEDKPILFSQEHLRLGISPKNIDIEKHTHGLSINNYIRLIEELKSPCIISDSYNPKNPTSIIVTTGMVDIDRLPIIACIKTDGQGIHVLEEFSSNYLTSVYGKNSYDFLLKESIKQNKVLYVNKEKTQALESFADQQLLRAFPKDFRFDVIIQHSKNIVKCEKSEVDEYANPEHDPVESSKGVVGKTDPGVSGPKR